LGGYLASALHLAIWSLGRPALEREDHVADFTTGWHVVLVFLGATFFGAVYSWTHDPHPQFTDLWRYRQATRVERLAEPKLPLPPGADPIVP
jgi:hypothetical protein